MKKIGVVLFALIMALGWLIPMASPAVATSVGPNIVDTNWQKTTNYVVENTFGSTAYSCNDSYWQWTPNVWDGPGTNPDGIVIPDYSADFWATWTHHGTMWTQATHQWFKTTLPIPCTAQLTQDVKLVSRGETPDMLTINDNIYVYVNGQYAASGGTAGVPFVNNLMGNPTLPADFVAGTPSYENLPYWAPASDTGWYLDGGLTLPKGLFHSGNNDICILAEEVDVWGGMGHLVFSNVTYELPDVTWITPQQDSDIALKYGCCPTVPVKFQLTTQAGSLITALQNIYLTVTGPSYNRTWQSGKGLCKLAFCRGTYTASICQDIRNPLKEGLYTASVYDACSNTLLGTITFTISPEAKSGCAFKRHGTFSWGMDNFHVFFKGWRH